MSGLWKRGFEQFTKDIKREHVLKALEEIDRMGIPSDARSTTYDLIEGQHRYPPKLVLSLASKHASGVEFDRSLFTGGEVSPAFALLRKLNFHIERKDYVEGEHEIDFPDGKRYWIFQANPKYYDIESALKQLPEQTWLTSQSHKQIQVGDTAYIWKSGQSAGIIAVASVLTKPAEMFAADARTLDCCTSPSCNVGFRERLAFWEMLQLNQYRILTCLHRLFTITLLLENAAAQKIGLRPVYSRPE